MAGAVPLFAALWPAQPLRSQGSPPLEFDLSLNGTYKKLEGLELSDGCRFEGDTTFTFAASGPLLPEPPTEDGVSFDAGAKPAVKGQISSGDFFLVCENFREQIGHRRELPSQKFDASLTVLWNLGLENFIVVAEDTTSFILGAAAADRVQASPPLSLTQADFQQGFTKTYSLSGLMIPFGAGFAEYAVSGTLTLRYKQQQQRESVTLDGCADVAVGSSSNVTAVGKPAGGSYRWWTEPQGLISVSPLGASAALSGDAPGTTTVHVEYTARSGKKAQASKPASSVRVVSINGGGPIPKLGLYDADGKPANPKRTVPLHVEPAGDTHLIFPAANPANASVNNHGSSLELQGTKVGKTTIQGQNQCGQKSGPVATVDVVNCDDDVIAELKRREEKLNGEIKELAAKLAERAKDLEKAANQDNKDFADMSVSILKLGTAPLSGTAATVVTAIGTAYSVLKNEIFGTEADTTSGPIGVGENADVTGAQTDILKEGLGKKLETYDKFVKAGKAVDVLGKLVSFANDAKAFKEAAEKLIDNGGTLGGLAKTIRDLGQQTEDKGKQRDVIVSRAKFCQQGAGTPGGGPPASGTPGGGTPRGSTPGDSTPGGSTPGGSTPGGGTPGGGTPGGGTPGGGTPGGATSGGGPGVDLDDMLQLEQRCQKPVGQLAGPTLATFQSDVEKVQFVLEDAVKTAGLSDDQRKKRLAVGLPILAAFLSKTKSFGGQVDGVLVSTKGCNEGRTAVVGKVGASAKQLSLNSLQQTR